MNPQRLNQSLEGQLTKPTYRINQTVKETHLNQTNVLGYRRGSLTKNETRNINKKTNFIVGPDETSEHKI